MSEVSLDGDWVVAAYRSGDGLVAPIDDGPDLKLTIDGSDISGTMGVNRFAGHLQDGVIAGPLATTRMAGPPELMSQEDELLAHLAAADEILVDGEGMTLRSDGLNLVELRLSGTNETNGSS